MAESPECKVENFLNRLRSGEIVVTEHKCAGDFYTAWTVYKNARPAAYMDPLVVQKMIDAIDTALIKRVIILREELLLRLSQAIKTGQINEQDIDRIRGDSSVKNYLKRLWNTFGDKSPREITKELSEIVSKGLTFATFIQVLMGIAKGLGESAGSAGFL